MIRKSLMLTITFAMLALPIFCRAQDQQPNIDTAIAMIRAGMQADRTTIITTTMEFSDKDAAAFWPIYRKYESERAALDDRRVAVIKEYAQKYPNVTDAAAKAMAEQMFACESGIAAAKKKYFKEFNKILPALTVARFFQLDHRMDLVMDLKVEASLPPLGQPQTSEEK